MLFSATWAQRNGKIFSAKKRNIPIIIKLIKKYAFLPKLAAPQELLNTLSQNLPNLILPFFFSPQHIGFYWLSIKVLQIPSTIIGNSVRQVLYAKICSLQNQNKPSSYIIIQYSIILFTIGTIMLAPVAIWGVEIFTLAFGRNWTEAGEYSKWIAPWIIMGFSNIPSTCAIQALKLQKKLLCWESFHFTARTATLLYVPLQYGMEQTVAAYATVGIVFNVILIAMGLYYSNMMLKKEKVEEK
ncbi:hypothetical protein TH25_01625 [Thalassospira profundimaris]|uniref:Uncharacterized protein n=2 Tax=Thalassospira profundimaris TaxID=502049 RepID=A0A367XKV6_9PROT|nr:hypothetical protein TH25_01625 [Thalassospira profundimaris]